MQGPVRPSSPPDRLTGHGRPEPGAPQGRVLAGHVVQRGVLGFQDFACLRRMSDLQHEFRAGAGLQQKILIALAREGARRGGDAKQVPGERHGLCLGQTRGGLRDGLHESPCSGIFQ